MKMRTLSALLTTLALLLGMLNAAAAPQPLDDAELAAVAGRDGVALAVHLDLNAARLAGAGQSTDARLLVGYRVEGQTSYAVLQDIGGQMTLAALTLKVRERADGGGDYVDIGMPSFVGFSRFGFRAMGALSDPSLPLTPANSLGGLQLNGSAAMTGHVYVWAQ
jgi:hypothetical protein